MLITNENVFLSITEQRLENYLSLEEDKFLLIYWHIIVILNLTYDDIDSCNNDSLAYKNNTFYRSFIKLIKR